MNYSPVSPCGPAGLLTQLAEASGRQCTAAWYLSLSASADGEDGKDGVSMRWGSSRA
jgi:hypothetical protein